MRATSIEIREIEAEAAPDVIELAAADAVSFRALFAVRSSAGVRFERTLLRRAGPEVLAKSLPSMMIALADARIRGSLDDLLAADRAAALAVAVVAVESLPAERRLGDLERLFDAVLPVLVARGADARVPLGQALRALTAFATADCIQLPVDEVYPFFVRGGRLASGSAVGDDVDALTATALAAAGLTATSRTARVLLHVETTAQDLARDLVVAADALRRVVRVDRLDPIASVSTGGRKAVSLIAACPSG